MGKTEVYSWRVEPQLKADLEAEARRREISVSRLLERIVTSWLKQEQPSENDEAVQARLRAKALRAAGQLKGVDDPHIAGQASARVKAKLRARYATDRTD